MQRPRKRSVVLLFVVCSTWALAAKAAPITFNTALPVSKGEFVFRGQYVVTRSADDPSVADRDRTSQALVAVLGYGVSGNLAVFGVLPYIDNELKLRAGGQPVVRSANGLGDLSAFARYTVWQRDRPGRTFRVAPFVGIKAPTGEDDASDALGTLPPSVQLGSGAWDGFAGAVATYQTLNYQVDGQLSYRANGRANDFQAGNIRRLDVSVQYRLRPRAFDEAVPAFLYGVMEANLIHQDENRASGREDPNSGGTTLFLTPGLQYVTRRWIVESALQLPVSQHLNGTALENDFIARLSFRVNF